MSIKHDLINPLLFAFGSVASLGCAAGVDLPAEGEEAAVESGTASLLLAEAPLPGGGTAEFFADDDGGVLIVATTQEGAARPLDNPDLQGLKMAEIYEYWAGEQAPPSLDGYDFGLPETPVDADEPALVDPPVLAQLDADPSAAGKVSASTSALSSTDFIASNCRDTDFEICLVNRTNDWSSSKRAYGLKSWTNPYRGTVRVKVDRKRRPRGRWINVKNIVIEDDEVKSISYNHPSVYRRDLRFRMTEASGDGWHVAVNFY